MRSKTHSCPVCNCCYNKKQRQPKVNECGHTLCQACCKTQANCSKCQAIIKKDSLRNNLALLEDLDERLGIIDYDKNINACFIGEIGVGKTSLIRRLADFQFIEYLPSTIGLDFLIVKREIDGSIIRFQLWDTAGQEKFRSMATNHIKNSQVIFIVYDGTQYSYLNNVSSLYNTAHQLCHKETKIVLVQNKIDMVNQKVQDCLDQEILAKIKGLQINHCKVSCRTAEGIEQIWNIIQGHVQLILTKQRQLLNEKQEKQKPKQTEISSKQLQDNKSKSCKC